MAEAYCADPHNIVARRHRRRGLDPPVPRRRRRVHGLLGRLHRSRAPCRRDAHDRHPGGGRGREPAPGREPRVANVASETTAPNTTASGPAKLKLKGRKKDCQRPLLPRVLRAGIHAQVQPGRRLLRPLLGLPHRRPAQGHPHPPGACHRPGRQRGRLTRVGHVARDKEKEEEQREVAQPAGPRRWAPKQAMMRRRASQRAAGRSRRPPKVGDGR